MSSIESGLAEISRLIQKARAIESVGEDQFFEQSTRGQAWRDSAMMTIVQIATIAERLPDSFKIHHSAVNWRGIRQTRNRVGHQYEGVTDRFLWNTVRVDIPLMGKQLGLRGPK